MKLITGEHTKSLDLALIKEFNDLTYQLNSEFYLLSLEGVQFKYHQIKELNVLLYIGKKE